MTEVTLHNRKTETVLVDDEDAVRMAPYLWSLTQTPGGGQIYCNRLKKKLATFILGRKPKVKARLEFANGNRRDYTRSNIRWNCDSPVCPRCGATKFFGTSCWDCYSRSAIDRIAASPVVFRNAAQSDHYAYLFLADHGALGRKS